MTLRRAAPSPVSRRRLLGGALAGGAGLAAAALVGCGDDASSGSPTPTAATGAGTTSARRAPRGTVTMALVTLADQSTDPHVTRTSNLAPITTSCFEQLSRWDAKGNLVPALARTMEEPPDHSQLTFTLREDATFWDGTPVTAEDVKWSYERYIGLANGDTYQATVKQQVASVTAPDPHTVVIAMAQPNTLRLSYGIINPRGWNIASRAYHERVGEDTFRTAPMASGPFKLVHSEPLQYVELEAYAGHYERPPLVQSIRMNVVAEQATRLAQLQTGAVGFIDGVGGPARTQVQGQKGITLYESAAAALTTLYFQQPTIAPYNDLRVRQALQLATDQEALIQTLLGGAGQRSPAAHIFPVTRGYDAQALGTQPFDPKQAKALVSASGLTGDALNVQLWAYDSSSAPQIPRMTEAVAAMWRDAGFDVALKVLEAGTYLQRYTARNLGGLAALASGAWFDGEALLRTDYLDGQPYGAATTPAIKQAILDLGQQFDEDRRGAAISDVYRQLIDGAWSVTLPWAAADWAVRDDRVKRWQPFPAWAYPHALETLEAAGA
jgi:peptide/nickel transport system substrate-binding protein